MNFILIFILPSVFGFKLMYDNIDKKDKFILFIYECMLLVITNIICMALVLFKNKGDCNIFTYAEGSISFSIIYMLLSIFVSCIVGFIITVISKFFSIDIEVKHEKKDKKHIKNSK